MCRFFNRLSRHRPQRRLHRILAEARAAEQVPWDSDKLLVYRSIFPQMAGWLPEEEAAQLRFQFETEITRLKAA
jgi:hypothetical protein